jgi:type II secretory pathway pseudopilin PulG
MSSTNEPKKPKNAAEAGFTLVEAITAFLILIIGLQAIVNLFLVASTSTQVAKQTTATTAQAAEVMEVLKAVPYRELWTPAAETDTTQYSPGDKRGNIDIQTDSANVVEDETPVDVDVTGGADAGNVDVFAVDRNVDGVGQIRIRWEFTSIDDQTRMIKVSAAPDPIVYRGRGRVDLFTIRSCTAPQQGCPAIPP